MDRSIDREIHVLDGSIYMIYRMIYKMLKSRHVIAAVVIKDDI